MRKQITLNKIQEQMLVEMLGWSREGYCYGYWKFEIPNGKGGYLSKNELKKEMKPMLDVGIIKCIKGLIDDEGMLCGSGFEIAHEHKTNVERAVKRYVEIDEIIEEMYKSEDIFKKQLAVLYKIGIPVQQEKLRDAFSGLFEVVRNKIQREKGGNSSQD